MMFGLRNKYAVITGAGSGIGLASAKLFARAGAAVMMCDIDHALITDQAAAIAAESEAPVSGVAFDVSSEESVLRGFSAMKSDKIDILVNSAGVAHIGKVESTSVTDFDRLYEVNVRGTFLCMRAVIPILQARGGGSIVNMASVAASTGLSDRFAYSMTKGAVRAMTLSVARDYIASGIRCNCISPARIHTPFVDGFVAKNYPGQEEAKMQELARAQPIGRMGEPEEVAALALYLCSDEASFVTGTDYPIDGGFLNLR